LGDRSTDKVLWLAIVFVYPLIDFMFLTFLTLLGAVIP
jgi:hypothetical protein